MVRHPGNALTAKCLSLPPQNLKLALFNSILLVSWMNNQSITHVSPVKAFRQVQVTTCGPLKSYNRRAAGVSEVVLKKTSLSPSSSASVEAP